MTELKDKMFWNIHIHMDQNKIWIRKIIFSELIWSVYFDHFAGQNFKFYKIFGFTILEIITEQILVNSEKIRNVPLANKSAGSSQGIFSQFIQTLTHGDKRFVSYAKTTDYSESHFKPEHVILQLVFL